MASSIYGTEVALPAANGMKGSGGMTSGSNKDAKKFIGITSASPANSNTAYSKIAVNAMGKNGTAMLKTTKKGRIK